MWRVGVALAGLIVVLIGAVLLFIPGPGWAIIFLGLGIWSTEFRVGQVLAEIGATSRRQMDSMDRAPAALAGGTGWRSRPRGRGRRSVVTRQVRRQSMNTAHGPVMAASLDRGEPPRSRIQSRLVAALPHDGPRRRFPPC